MHCPYPSSRQALVPRTASNIMPLHVPSALKPVASPIDAILLKHNERVVQSARQAIRETKALLQSQRCGKTRHDVLSLITPTARKEFGPTTRENVIRSNMTENIPPLPNIGQFFQPLNPQGLTRPYRENSLSVRKICDDQLFGHDQRHFGKSLQLAHQRQVTRDVGLDGDRFFRQLSSASDDNDASDSWSSNGTGSPRIAPSLTSPAGSNDAVSPISKYDTMNDMTPRGRRLALDEVPGYLRIASPMKENLSENINRGHGMGYEHFDWRRERSPPRILHQHHQRPTNVHPDFRTKTPVSMHHDDKVHLAPLPDVSHHRLTMFQKKLPDNQASAKPCSPGSPGSDMVTSKDGKKRGYLCKVCGKVYCRKYVLKIHQRVHSGEKPLECKVCGKCFSDPSNMKKHVKLHETNHVTYTCEFCRRHFATWKGRENHVINVHQETGDVLQTNA